MRRVALVAVLLCLVPTAPVLHAQAGAPAFDVASVRPLQPGEPRGSDAVRVLPGGQLTASAVTLRNLITAAYGVEDIQVVDDKRLLPDDRFAVTARTRAGVTAADARAMLKTLLASRFKLAVHEERRDLPVYVMTTARADGRLGEQLRRSGPECAPPRGPANVPAPPPPPPPPGGPPPADAITLGPEPMRCLALAFNSTLGAHMSLRAVTMNRFASLLTARVGRPVVNRTALAGEFDVDVTYTEDTAKIDVDGFANAPSLFTAMQEQLGLKLESSRAPVDVIVVDAVGRLIEN